MLDREKLNRAAEKVRAQLDLLPEDLQILQREAHMLYEEVSYDLEPDNRRGTCKRATILEIVTDAGRLELRIRQRRVERIARQDTERLVKACRSEKIADLIGPAFPFAEYEVGSNGH
jgi:hypothetical protein